MDMPEIIHQIVALLGFSETPIQIDETKDSIVVDIQASQEESGILIGYRGEKINALQFLLNLIQANTSSDSFKPVQVDIAGYRQRRQTQLEELATSAAEKAIQSHREILLPPLTNSERRIIHLFLESNQQVTTYSEGEGADRRLVVRPL